MSMKFLIVSDTHGRMYNLEEAMEREEFDGMIHCGDVEGMDDLIKSKVNGPCYMVMGNNDWFSNLPAEIQVNIDDYRAFITHGHNYGVSLGLEGIYAEALSRGVDIVLFGHTHRPVAEKTWKSLDCQSGQPHVSASDGKKTKLCHADDQ